MASYTFTNHVRDMYEFIDSTCYEETWLIMLHEKRGNPTGTLYYEINGAFANWYSFNRDTFINTGEFFTMTEDYTVSYLERHTMKNDEIVSIIHAYKVEG